MQPRKFALTSDSLSIRLLDSRGCTPGPDEEDHWMFGPGDKLLITLGDPEVTANIYCKSRNLPNTDTQNYSTDLR